MSALNHCTLCAMTMGVARLIHALERSGLTSPWARVAAGDSHRHVRPRQRAPRPASASGARRLGGDAAVPGGLRSAGALAVEPVLGLAHRLPPPGGAATSSGASRLPRALAGLGHRAGPELERAQGHGLVLVGQVAGDGDQVLVDGAVGRGQRAGALGGQAQRDPAAVGVLLAAVDQAAGHQAVDEGRDGRAPHGQPVGQARGGGGALGQDPEHPVLGQRQVDLRQGHLDPLGEPGRDAAVRPEHGDGATAAFLGGAAAPAAGLRRGAAAVEGGEETDTSTIIQLERLTTCGAAGAGVPPTSPFAGLPLRVELAQEQVAALLLVGLPDGAGREPQRIERAEEPPVRLVAPAHVPRATPARGAAGCRARGGSRPVRRRSGRSGRRRSRRGRPKPAGSGGQWRRPRPPPPAAGLVGGTGLRRGRPPVPAPAARGRCRGFRT